MIGFPSKATDRELGSKFERVFRPLAPRMPWEQTAAFRPLAPRIAWEQTAVFRPLAPRSGERARERGHSPSA
jgi:hypothetical protein